jgi:outer membrane protein
MQQWTIELEGLERNIRAQQEKIKSQALLLSREKLDEMQTELDQMIGEYETKKSEIADPVQGKAVQRNQELSSPINQRITTVVEQLGAEGGFSMILDVATVNVVYAAEGIDLTDRVLEELAKSSSE